MSIKNPKFSLRAECSIAVEKALWKRGLGLDYGAQKYLAADIMRLCDDYVPFSGGGGVHLKNRARIAKDGSSITYPGPYAHYQYMGIVYEGSGPKHPTDRALSYRGAPMRGKLWDRRMMADRRTKVVKDVENYIKNRARKGY